MTETMDYNFGYRQNPNRTVAENDEVRSHQERIYFSKMWDMFSDGQIRTIKVIRQTKYPQGYGIPEERFVTIQTTLVHQQDWVASPNIIEFEKAKSMNFFQRFMFLITRKW